MPQRFIPELDPDRPLILSDADEVLLQFIYSFETFLKCEGYDISMTEFRLAGNIRKRGNPEASTQKEVSDLLGMFFDTETENIPPVPGACDALKRLNEQAQILIISNVPKRVESRRRKALKDLGMAFPVLANSGAKGPAIAEIQAHMRAPVLFIDDLPPHHQSVAKAAPDVHRLHFIADPRLALLIGKAEHAHARIDTWPEATDYILQHFAKFGH